MVLNYFGIQKSERELTEGMTRDDSLGGTYIYENGSLMLNQGLKVHLLTANPLLFPRDKRAGLKKMDRLQEYLQDFQKRTPKREKPLELFKLFIAGGGKVKVQIPDFEHIQEAIDKEQLILASIQGAALGSREGGYHYVVVSGYKENAVYINNPLPGSKTGWFPVKDFIHAVLSSSCFDVDNGSLLIVGR